MLHGISDRGITDASARHVLIEVKNYLELSDRRHQEIDGVINILESLGHSETETKHLAPNIPAHSNLLNSAISKIPEGKLSKLKSTLAVAKDDLVWRVDNGSYYAEEADVGDGYRNGNMHALLVGPSNSPFFANDFLLGLFLLTPNTLYRDHKHLAPEIYVPLTGPSGWRFDKGAWKDHPAGHLIFNKPDTVHATRVYDVPFLALFAWTQNIHSPCGLVPAPDWAKIEAELAS